jgi:DNA invertase Pin-like site-specific DNA recombinase
MKFGYARVSTRDQNLDPQRDQLRQAGCEEILEEIASGAKSERPVLRGLLEQMRTGDVLVVWKLDRLGRSLRDLVNLVSTLMEKGVGLKSLQDPIDTTSSQGRLVFNIFASLAEFERDLIIERTRAGLSAARARGRKGGRPKGLSADAEKKAVAAEALYKEGDLSVNAIAENLGVSKSTLYKYLRHRGVEVGSFRKSKPATQPKTLKVTLHLRVENNSKFVRGKKRSREDIERFILSQYGMHKPDPKGCDYELTIPYENDKDLDNTIYDILQEAESIADMRNGFIEADVVAQDGSDRYW